MVKHRLFSSYLEKKRCLFRGVRYSTNPFFLSQCYLLRHFMIYSFLGQGCQFLSLSDWQAVQTLTGLPIFSNFLPEASSQIACWGTSPIPSEQYLRYWLLVHSERFILYDHIHFSLCAVTLRHNSHLDCLMLI